jgi:hypothetical protein
LFGNNLKNSMKNNRGNEKGEEVPAAGNGVEEAFDSDELERHEKERSGQLLEGMDPITG